MGLTSDRISEVKLYCSRYFLTQKSFKYMHLRTRNPNFINLAVTGNQGGGIGSGTGVIKPDFSDLVVVDGNHFPT